MDMEMKEMMGEEYKMEEVDESKVTLTEMSDDELDAITGGSWSGDKEFREKWDFEYRLAQIRTRTVKCTYKGKKWTIVGSQVQIAKTSSGAFSRAKFVSFKLERKENGAVKTVDALAGSVKVLS